MENKKAMDRVNIHYRKFTVGDDKFPTGKEEVSRYNTYFDAAYNDQTDQLEMILRAEEILENKNEIIDHDEREISIVLERQAAELLYKLLDGYLHGNIENTMKEIEMENAAELALKEARANGRIEYDAEDYIRGIMKDAVEDVLREMGEDPEEVADSVD